MEQVPAKTYSIPVFRQAELEDRIKKLNRRAAKGGFPLVTLNILGTRKVSIRDEHTDLPTGRCRVYLDFTLEGEAPIIAGHTFLATIQHTEAGNIVRNSPLGQGVDLSTYRTAATLCEHCSTNRRRNDTYILKTPEGTTLQVGRSCLQKYLGTKDVAQAISLWTLESEILAMGSGGDEGGWGSHPPEVSVDHFMACAFKSIRSEGWVSRAQSQNDGRASTAQVATWASGMPPRDPQDLQDWREAQPEEKDVKMAEKAIEWIKGWEAKSDFEHNVQVAANLEYVSRTGGLLAAGANSYLRHLQIETEKAREVPAKNEWVGEPKQRFEATLTVKRVQYFEGGFGMTTWVHLTDAEGRTFLWKASGSHNYEAGDMVKGKVTVKAHEEYKGTKQTLLSRCSFEVVES